MEWINEVKDVTDIVEPNSNCALNTCWKRDFDDGECVIQFCLTRFGCVIQYA